MKISIIFICLSMLILTRNSCNGQISITDVITGAVDAVKGNIIKLPDLIPTPKDILHLRKNIVLGLPAVATITALNVVCANAFSAKTVEPKEKPEYSKLKYNLYKPNKEPIAIPLDKPNDLLDNEYFNKSLPTAIFMTGFLTNYENQKSIINNSLDLILDAYICRGDTNFITIDPSNYFDTIYSWAVFNTQPIAKLLAKSLVELTQNYPLEQIHLIGHSLGAQVLSATARYYYKNTTEKFERLTGLDPARPCFLEGKDITSISRGDAKFVDIIHSNIGVFGTLYDLGDVDFYPNGLGPIQPGCQLIACSHTRSALYYGESVYPGNENAFMAVRCNSLFSVNHDYCHGEPEPMGFTTKSNLRGHYFLNTHSHSPFGTNSLKRSDVECKNK